MFNFIAISIFYRDETYWLFRLFVIFTTFLILDPVLRCVVILGTFNLNKFEFLQYGYKGANFFDWSVVIVILLFMLTVLNNHFDPSSLVMSNVRQPSHYIHQSKFLSSTYGTKIDKKKKRSKLHHEFLELHAFLCTQEKLLDKIKLGR